MGPEILKELHLWLCGRVMLEVHVQGTSNASTVQPVIDTERTVFCERPGLLAGHCSTCAACSNPSAAT